MSFIRPSRRVLCALLFLWSACDPASAQQQAQTKISNFERDEVVQMLTAISDDVKKHYYD